MAKGTGLAFRVVAAAGLAVLAVLFAGCSDESDRPAGKRREKPADATLVPFSTNVSLEVQGDRRRVLVSGEVCLRKGPLEVFLCRKGTKEHESIVSADVDARSIHTALVTAKAEPGSPVRFEPRYRPARGSVIKVSVEYNRRGRKVTVPAQSWVRDGRTGKPMQVDWVFAGSHLVSNPLDRNGPKIYLANEEGAIISVSNFESSVLDLPVKSSKDDAELSYEAFTEHIPPEGTKVVVVLEPVKNQ
jgi:hypothetical protein